MFLFRLIIFVLNRIFLLQRFLPRMLNQCRVYFFIFLFHFLRVVPMVVETLFVNTQVNNVLRFLLCFIYKNRLKSIGIIRVEGDLLC